MSKHGSYTLLLRDASFRVCIKLLALLRIVLGCCKYSALNVNAQRAAYVHKHEAQEQVAIATVSTCSIVRHCCQPLLLLSVVLLLQLMSQLKLSAVAASSAAAAVATCMTVTAVTAAATVPATATTVAATAIAVAAAAKSFCSIVNHCSYCCCKQHTVLQLFLTEPTRCATCEALRHYTAQLDMHRLLIKYGA
eukprot:3335-Heterococcus_DN1.PRE.2